MKSELQTFNSFCTNVFQKQNEDRLEKDLEELIMKHLCSQEEEDEDNEDEVTPQSI